MLDRPLDMKQPFILSIYSGLSSSHSRPRTSPRSATWCPNLHIHPESILVNMKRISANEEEMLRLYTEYTSMHVCFSEEMVHKQASTG